MPSYATASGGLLAADLTGLGNWIWLTYMYIVYTVCIKALVCVCSLIGEIKAFPPWGCGGGGASLENF